jgi:hypothetical protein
MNMTLFRPKLFKLQFSSSAPARQLAKSSSNFSRSRSATLTSQGLRP